MSPAGSPLETDSPYCLFTWFFLRFLCSVVLPDELAEPADPGKKIKSKKNYYQEGGVHGAPFQNQNENIGTEYQKKEREAEP